jgi:hypothetical protein
MSQERAAVTGRADAAGRPPGVRSRRNLRIAAGSWRHRGTAASSGQRVRGTSTTSVESGNDGSPRWNPRLPRARTASHLVEAARPARHFSSKSPVLRSSRRIVAASTTQRTLRRTCAMRRPLRSGDRARAETRRPCAQPASERWLRLVGWVVSPRGFSVPGTSEASSLERQAVGRAGVGPALGPLAALFLALSPAGWSAAARSRTSPLADTSARMVELAQVRSAAVLPPCPRRSGRVRPPRGHASRR